MARKSKRTKKKLALELIERLKQEYPDSDCSLEYNEAWKLLVSVRLAAQCTDARVNVVDVVQNLTAIAQQNAASTQETSASVTEVSGIVYDISSNAEKLKAIADELEKNMKVFRI